MSNTAVEAKSSVLLEEYVDKSERIECVGFCHNGPIDDSAKAIKYAADHDPDAAAEFLFISSCCDNQLPLCAKKVDAILLSIILGSKL